MKLTLGPDLEFDEHTADQLRRGQLAPAPGEPTHPGPPAGPFLQEPVVAVSTSQVATVFAVAVGLLNSLLQYLTNLALWLFHLVIWLLLLPFRMLGLLLSGVGRLGDLVIELLARILRQWRVIVAVLALTWISRAAWRGELDAHFQQVRTWATTVRAKDQTTGLTQRSSASRQKENLCAPAKVPLARARRWQAARPWVNVRSGPGTTFVSQGRVGEGALAAVRGAEVDGWLPVSLADGREGFVKSGLGMGLGEAPCGELEVPAGTQICARARLPCIEIRQTEGVECWAHSRREPGPPGWTAVLLDSRRTVWLRGPQAR